MGNFFANLIAMVGMGLMVLIAILIGGFYIVSFSFGMEHWLGWEGFWVPIVGAFVYLFLGGPGAVVLAAIGGYGAYAEWDWPIWVCVLVYFPGFAFLIGGVVISLLGAMFRRREY